MSREIRVSATRLKSLWDCTVQFYYKEILRLPDSGHYKARQGDAMHSLFEDLLKSKRRALLRSIIVDGVDPAAIPVILRFIRAYDRRYAISPYEMQDMTNMLKVAFLGIVPYFKPYFAALDAGLPRPFVYHTEYRFKIAVGKAVLSGFIDLILIYPDHVIVVDLKSQAKKFTQAELPHNPQAIVYQLVAYREFGFLPPVEFILLRHAPSKRYPSLHIQRVEPPPLVALRGLEDYVDYTYGIVNSFGLQEAYSRPHRDIGFCERVCRYRKPFTYTALVHKGDLNGQPIETFEVGQKQTKPAADEVLVERQHEGCPFRWKG